MSISDIKYENYELESALDEVAVLKEKIKELKAERDTWRDLAERQRDMAVECRKKLSETTDAYNKLYDAAVEFINA